MPEWVYFACCYGAANVGKAYPFGFCRSCWIAAGRPQPMGGFTEPEDDEE